MDVLEEAGGVRGEAHHELRDLVFLHRVQHGCVAGVDVPKEDLAALPMARAVRQQRGVQPVPSPTRDQQVTNNNVSARAAWGTWRGRAHRSPTIGMRGRSE